MVDFRSMLAMQPSGALLPDTVPPQPGTSSYPFPPTSLPQTGFLASMQNLSRQTLALDHMVHSSSATFASPADLSMAVQSVRLHLLELSQRLDALEAASSTSTPSTPVPSLSQQPFTAPEAEAKPPVGRAKNRRVQLSKAIRQTMLEMMGLTSTSQELPEYDPSSPAPQSSTNPTWSWEFSKTMAASAHNREFAAALAARVEEDRKTRRKWEKVPEEDWPYLYKAIDTAYINLRREFDSRTNESKRAKKDLTKKRNRRRGLKDEKLKRRRTALEHLIATDQLLTETKAAGLPPDESLLRHAADIKYMSSEESDAGEASALVDELAAEGVPATKIFRVHPPAWRSKHISKFFERLDAIKPPERAYKRIRGDPREGGDPPPGTPLELLDPDWSTANPEPVAKKRRISND